MNMSAFFPRAEFGRKLRAPLLSLAFAICAVLPAAAGDGYVTGLKTYPLRDTPDYSAAATARLRLGDKLTVIEERAGWVRIEMGERAGWMPSSVIGSQAPQSVQVGPLRERMKEMEADLSRLAGENTALQEGNRNLSERAAALEKELEKSRQTVAGRKSDQRLWGIALGGGLVIFGWATGYALAIASRRKVSRGKYLID